MLKSIKSLTCHYESYRILINHDIQPRMAQIKRKTIYASNINGVECIEKLVDSIEQFNKGEIDADTSFKIDKQILTDEIDDPEFLEFAIENFSEMMGYNASGIVNIRIHRDIEGEMWFGVGQGITHSYKRHRRWQEYSLIRHGYEVSQGIHR